MKNSKTLLFINIFLLLALIFVLVKENYPQRILFRINGPEDVVESKSYLETEEYRHAMGLYDIYQKKGDVVMLGNSITYRVNWNELLNRSDMINRGIGNDITHGFIERLQTVINVEPKLCFIMGGVNDLDKGVDPQHIINNLKSISKSLRRNGIMPLVQSILHVSTDYPDYKQMNAKVKAVNNLIKQFCHAESIEFIDLNDHFTKHDVLLKEYSFDGIHLNADAYKKWGEIIKPIIIKNLNSLNTEKAL